MTDIQTALKSLLEAGDRAIAVGSRPLYFYEIEVQTKESVEGRIVNGTITISARNRMEARRKAEAIGLVVRSINMVG